MVQRPGDAALCGDPALLLFLLGPGARRAACPELGDPRGPAGPGSAWEQSLGSEPEFGGAVSAEMSLKVTSVGKFTVMLPLALKHHLLGRFSVFIAHCRITPLFTSFLPRCEIRKHLLL